MKARSVAVVTLAAIAAMLLPVAAAEGPAKEKESRDTESIVAAAVRVAEAKTLPHVRREKNLTWQSDQLRNLAHLLAKAGRQDDAMRLVVRFETEERVKAPAFVPIAEAAIRAGDRGRTTEVIDRLAAMHEWTVPIALAEIARAMQAAGDTRGALLLAERVDQAEAQAKLYLDLGLLAQSLNAARSITPQSVHVPIGTEAVWEEDYGERQDFLLRLVAAFTARDDRDGAQRALQALNEVPDRTLHLHRVRGWLEIARRWPSPALDSARAEMESTPTERVGEVQETVEVLGALAEGLAAAGRQDQALAALTAAVEVAARLEPVKVPGLDAQPACAPLTAAARDHLKLGRKEEALALVARARRLIEEAPSTESASQDKVEALARLAVVLELAGETARGAAMLAEAVAGIPAIEDEEWRLYAWSAVAAAYQEAGRTDRAVEVLSAGRAPDPDKVYAVQNLVDAGATSGHYLALLPLVPDGWVRIGLTAKAAGGLEAAGRGAEAKPLITAVLAMLAARAASAEPEGWDSLLIQLALDYPGAGEPADAEQRTLLRRLVERAAAPVR